MATATPNWMMLDRFVFRRDNAESFPGDDAAPFRAEGIFLDRPFTVAFYIAEPPNISRFYMHWPSGQDRHKRNSCIVAAHRNLLLFRLIPDHAATADPSFLFSQHDHFICRASPSKSPLLLRKIPMCRTPMVLCVKDGKKITTERSFDDIHPVSILCRGEEEFALAQLNLITPRLSVNKMQAELCVLRSKVGSSDHKWEVEQHLPIKYQEHEFLDLSRWTTDTIIPFNNHLCWVNYSVGGVLFCKVLEENPLITYLRLPIPDRCFRRRPFLDTNRSVCVTKTTIGGRGYEQLNFIDIARKDGELNGPLCYDTRFSVTYHSLRTTESNGMQWDMTFFITSDELWTHNPLLPREALMYPIVDMDNPNLVYFLLREHKAGLTMNSMSVVAIDMSSKLVISTSSYIEEEDFSGTHADVAWRRRSFLQSFLRCEFPKCLNLTSSYEGPDETTSTQPGYEATASCPARNTRSRKRTSNVM